MHQQRDIKSYVNAHSGFLVCISSNLGEIYIKVCDHFYNLFNFCVVDFIENLPGVFEDMVDNKSSLQSTLTKLMETGTTDAYVTRLWSTSSSLISINRTNTDVEDYFYIVDDDSQSQSLCSVLEYVQNSSNKIIAVRVAENKYVNDYFGELYAYFLIQGHMHTTHYVSMAEEFPGSKDSATRIARVSSRCKKSVKDTKIIVFVNVACTKKKDAEAPDQEVETLLNATSVTDQTTNSSKISGEIWSNLLERLLIDGVNTVVFLTDNPDESMELPTLYNDVIQRVKEVSMHFAIYYIN